MTYFQSEKENERGKQPEYGKPSMEANNKR